MFYRKKGLAIVASLLLITALGLTGCGKSTGTTTEKAQTEKNITIKFGHAGPLDNPMHVAAMNFAKKVEERSKGSIKVNIFPASQLGNERDMVEGIQMGTIQMGDISNGPMGRFVPAAMLWDLPYIFRDYAHAHKVLDGEIGKSVADQFIPKGLRVLGYNDGGFRHLTNSKRPVLKPEDMAGFKVRVMESEVMMATFKAFDQVGAVPIAFGELYTALEQKVVDAQENPLNLIDSMKYYEVQKNLSLTGHFFYPRQYIISEKVYQAMSPEQQKIISEEAKAACLEQRKLNKEYEDKLVDILKKKGMQVSEVNKEPFAVVVRKIYPQFHARIGNGSDAKGKELIEKVLNTK